ncbi:hypothetical protein FIU97_07445 [Roseivivax sp. THAF40]|uniref:DUF3047 domain-containing protein n=1 Tax=unclassified Roseivivax TaxID=2639302 RepID=UPI001268036B|nr:MULTISPECIES: DUF3047 domain-containing protein [unclassified Roseivivax]QFS82637.1 hypothetical protein FIV09_07340 [Roseivivax sp. THAF197b]QFT46406.1 hypothetical protein FIU97_07445 [Roseivivax sp. THAF40]
MPKIFRFSARPVLSGALLAASLALPVGAASVPFEDSAWKVQRFSLFSGNDYGFEGDSLSVASDGTVSIAYRPLAPANWGARSASWSWSVDASVPATDLTQKGGDDRNLAVYFVFLPEAQARELQGASITRLLNEDAIRALVYVWGGDHGRGDVLPSPYLGERGKTVVLRAAGTGAHGEDIDLAADYARAFGSDAPGALVGIAVSGDSDDTESRIDASIRNLAVN